jgi:hypothetical protein
MADKFNLEGFRVTTDNQVIAEGGYGGSLATYDDDGEISTDALIVGVGTPAGVKNNTLPNGITGQTIKIYNIGAGSANVVITPANLFGGTSITLSGGEVVELTFDGSQWVIFTNTGTVA